MGDTNKVSVWKDDAEDFVNKLVDDYKFGVLSAEEVCSDHLLYFGRTFSEEIEEYLETGLDRADPVEYTDRFLAIEPELEKLIREEVGEGGYLGFCHTYWRVKKRILKERYGIDWKSTADRFPGMMFD